MLQPGPSKLAKSSWVSMDTNIGSLGAEVAFHLARRLSNALLNRGSRLLSRGKPTLQTSMSTKRHRLHGCLNDRRKRVRKGMVLAWRAQSIIARSAQHESNTVLPTRTKTVLHHAALVRKAAGANGRSVDIVFLAYFPGGGCSFCQWKFSCADSWSPACTLCSVAYFISARARARARCYVQVTLRLRYVIGTAPMHILPQCASQQTPSFRRHIGLCSQLCKRSHQTAEDAYTSLSALFVSSEHG
mmetsp:Transcript_46807/g.122898  ORF Transcript_46807/g.122898 Transcript_46807/m.122898 type:complete len:244 (-) Transcript_46807:766-1497(-)